MSTRLQPPTAVVSVGNPTVVAVRWRVTVRHGDHPAWIYRRRAFLAADRYETVAFFFSCRKSSGPDENSLTDEIPIVRMTGGDSATEYDNSVVKLLPRVAPIPFFDNDGWWLAVPNAQNGSGRSVYSTCLKRLTHPFRRKKAGKMGNRPGRVCIANKHSPYRWFFYGSAISG